MIEVRAFVSELRALPEGMIEGTALRYGDTAIIEGGKRERFQPGAFGGSTREALQLNLQHDQDMKIGTATMTDSATALEARAQVPAGIHKLVKRGALSGFSIEFEALQERMDDDNVRVVEKAALQGLALVDAGAYPKSRVEARAAETWMTGGIPFNRTAVCECTKSGCDQVFIKEGAFDETLATVASGDTDIVLHTGSLNPQDIVASTGAGSLQMSTNERLLLLQLLREAQDTEAGRAVDDAMKVSRLTPRPIIDEEASTFTEDGNLRTYENAVLKSILLKHVPPSYGWLDMERGDKVPDMPEIPARRAALWL